MSARFFTEIEHGQNSSKLRMPICIYLQKTTLHLFPLVSIAYSRNKVCKNTCMSQPASFGTALLHNTISVVSLLSFLQMLTLTPRVKSSQLYQSQGQDCCSKLGLTLKVWVTEQGQGQDSCQGQGQCSGVKVIAQGQCQRLVFGFGVTGRGQIRVSASTQGQGQRSSLKLLLRVSTSDQVRIRVKVRVNAVLGEGKQSRLRKSSAQIDA